MKLKVNKALVGLAIFVSATAMAESAYLKLVGKADEAIVKEDWDEAERCLRDALREEPSNPGNVMLLSNLGMIQFYSGRDSLAIATLTEAHRIAPSATVILANRARVLTAIGALGAAVQDYNLIEQLDSVAWQPALYRGLIYLAWGDTVNAKSDLLRLTTLRPDHTDTHLALAALYSSLDRPAEALPQFTALIKADPQAEYYAGRAMCFIQRELYLDASEDIASGLELDDENAELYVCRALLNKRRYRPDEALADAQRAISLGADAARVRNLLNL